MAVETLKLEAHPRIVGVSGLVVHYTSHEVYEICVERWFAESMFPGRCLVTSFVRRSPWMSWRLSLDWSRPEHVEESHHTDMCWPIT